MTKLYSILNWILKILTNLLIKMGLNYSGNRKITQIIGYSHPPLVWKNMIKIFFQKYFLKMKYWRFCYTRKLLFKICSSYELFLLYCGYYITHRKQQRAIKIQWILMITFISIICSWTIRYDAKNTANLSLHNTNL